MRWIRPSVIDGTIAAPPSKSMTIRAAALALLGRNESILKNVSKCDDALAGFRVIRALGAHYTSWDGGIKIMGGRSVQESVLDCGESGLCIRMFAPIAGLFARLLTLTGEGSLRNRPMHMIERPLNQLGARCTTDRGFPPVQIQGPLHSGRVTVDGTLSSQFLTGLLIALPFCRGDSEIFVDGLKSRPYIRMTLTLLKAAGLTLDHDKNLKYFYIPGDQTLGGITVEVEGDWSAAAFLLAAGAIRGRVTVSNLRLQSQQADRRMLDALDAAQARVKAGGGTVTVEESGLKAFTFDATECPDLFPPLAVLACHCQGKSSISGVERLRHKESDRARALLSELKKIGAKISLSGNRMEITGSRITGGRIDAHGDHRIAMAGAIAGLRSAQGVRIRDWECVAKSYPQFFEDLISAGGNVL